MTFIRDPYTNRRAWYLCDLHNMATTQVERLQDFSRPLDLKQVKCGWYEAREVDYWVPEADVEGKIPVELYGTFFRNGPGLLEVYGKKLQHRE